MTNSIIKISLVWALVFSIFSCKKTDHPMPKENPKNIDSIAANYYEQYLKLYPLEATSQGDNRYNDLLPINIDKDFIAGEIAFYNSVQKQLESVDYSTLSDDKKTIYDVLNFTLKDKTEVYNYHPEYMPFNQFSGLPLSFPLLGSGEGSQPFKTTTDYDNWLKRMEKFPQWMDAAQNNFNEGISHKIVLPKKLVMKMIPQMRAEEITSTLPEKNIFFGPIKKFPNGFSQKDKDKYTALYKESINKNIIPAYKKMGDYLEKKYLPNARDTDGYYAIENGKEAYAYYSKSWTTTSLSPEEINKIGLEQVAYLRSEMEKVKKQIGFSGSLESFLVSLKNDPKAMPYKSAAEVISAFNKVLQKIEPQLKTMFGKFPKTSFEIRQTEKFRENSASAEYVQGTPDGARPGIFYIPLPNPAAYNVTSGMESLFLHEAIPGHHYQISLQQENDQLPKFMRFGWIGAYGEGWAHYCETLGEELGLYKDPYQKMGYLSDQMLRAVRLVVDVSLHNGSMTREQAIDYFLSNISYDNASATAEIERYMALPGQALGYKIGALKIRELRTKYEKELGSKFSLAAFHDEVLSQGCLPLEVLERKMANWAKKIKNNK